ncbi:MAG TPA: chromate transporter [Firmicutes bacterium]|jgi:chromate transporter|nr:chromate transporter [Bacillota bacterium]
MIYTQLFLTFFKIGLFSFGGGYAMLPLIQKEIVTNNSWLNLSQFVDVVAISQVTPGPIAINAATFVGYKMAGIFGSAAATLGVVTPSLIVVLSLTLLFLKYNTLDTVQAAFTGIRPAVVALIAAATWGIMPSSIQSVSSLAISVGAFIAIRRFHLDPIVTLLLAAGLGTVLYS